MKKETFRPPALMGSSLLVIFAVLVLSMLALLSLSTAKAQQRMAEASAHSLADYYEAEARAQEIFARLRNGEDCPQVTKNENLYTYACPISHHQSLQVTLSFADGRWQVLRWQSVASPGEISETVDIWDGSTGG